MSMNASVSAPGSSGARRASSARNSRPAFSSWQHVSPGIGAQVRAQRGRRADAAEQRAHRAVPQQVHVIDCPPRRPSPRPGTAPSAARSPRTRRPAGHAPRPGRPARPARPGPSPGPGRRATRDSGRRTMRGSSRGYATMPGSPGALQRRGPLRTVRASHPGTRLKQAARAFSGLKLWFRFPALPGIEPALAGCVHEACQVIVRRPGPPVVDEVAGGYRPAGDVQPPSFPFSGRRGGCPAGSRGSPHSGHCPSCLDSRFRLYASSGGLTFFRRSAQ